MKYCPKCGTANLDGSTFCSECGEDLVTQTQIECPGCGTLNPRQNVLCSECNGRLPTYAPSPPDVGATPTIKGLSLPTKSSPGEQDRDADDVAASAPEEEVPAWLRDLGSSLPADAEVDDANFQEDVEVPRWLRDLRSSLPEEAEERIEPKETEEAEAEILPDWLMAPDTTPSESETLDAGLDSEEESPVDEPQEDEVPGWLARLVPSAAAPGHETEVSQSEEEEVPGWLSRLVPGEEETQKEPAPAAPQGEESEILESLDDLDTAAVAEAAEAGARAEIEPPELVEEDEFPDWMAELQQVDGETGVEAEPSDSIEEGELPDWVTALRPADAEAETGPSVPEFEREEPPDRVAVPEPPSEELPLAEALDSTDDAEIEPPSKTTAFKLPAEVEAILGSAVPTWLAELQIEAPEAAAAIFEEAAVDGELPDWLLHSEIEPDESLAPAEIPGWLLALKPTELREQGTELSPPAATEWSEETGLLAGIPGTLPVEMLIAQPRAVAITESPDLTVEDSPPALLFSEIVGSSPEAAPKELATPEADVLPKAARWAIYAILILVVAVPIILGEPLLPRTIEPTAAIVEMHGAIESLDSNAPVLVAFDYDPASSGEMDPIARALIGHLMERGVRLVVVSLLPTGPATAQSLFDEMIVDHPSYAEGYGERYVNLGYLPGQAAAVRLLGLSVGTALPRDFSGKPLSDLPVMEGLDSAQAFSMIIELAATRDTLRWWVEQAGTPFAIPVGAGASASVIPFARPYYETESRQLVGLVGGVTDAVMYEALASGQSTPRNASAARLDSQSGAQLLLVLVILAGNVAYFWRRGTRRER